MLNCIWFEKIYLHYALWDFDSIFLHCTKLFIRQSIDREQIFDVTFETSPNWKILRTPLATTVIYSGIFILYIYLFAVLLFNFKSNIHFCKIILISA